MAQDVVKHNIIRFVVEGGDRDGVTLYLKVDGEWKLEVGMEPSIFTAITPYTEFDKIAADLADVRGRFEFFFDGDPTREDGPLGNVEPNVVMKGIILVDVKPERFGRVIVRDEGPNVVQDRYFEYRLTFADARHDLQMRKGLHRGPINVTPVDPETGLDANENPLYPTAILVNDCLKALGIFGRTLVHPDAINSDTPRAFNLEWWGNNAAAELGRLLELAGCVFAAKLDGTFKIERKGKGELPLPPADRVSIDSNYPGINGRGTEVLLYSWPNPILRTYEFTTDPEAPGGADLEFVVRDRLKNAGGGWRLEWNTLENAKWDMRDAARGHFVAVPLEELPAGDAYRYRSYYCRALRLKEQKWGRHPIFRETWQKEAPTFDGIDVEGDTLVEDGYGRLKQVHEAAIPVMAYEDGGRVLVLSRPAIITTKPIVGNWFDWFDKPGKVKVTATREVFDQKPDGSWEPVFYGLGFRAVLGGGVEQLSQDEAELLAAAGRTRLVSVPDLQAHQDNDGAFTNESELRAIGAQFANAYIGNSGNPGREVQVAGFFAAEPGGQVPAVYFGQSPPRTRWKAGVWYYPHDAGIREGNRDVFAPGRGREHYPSQRQLSAKRTARGSSGATQPAVMVEPGEGPPLPAYDRWVQRVALSVVDGNGGSKTSAPTFTYKVSSKYFDEVLSEKTSPVTGRRPGLHNAASEGLGVVDAEKKFHLLFAFETINTTECPAA